VHVNEINFEINKLQVFILGFLCSHEM